MTPYQEFIAASRYSRWIEEASRRETWEETVSRYVDYWYNKELIATHLKQRLYKAIKNLEVMPSMRCLMTAGPALDRDNMAGFNCSYVAVDDYKVFDEILYVLACGTGVGFSVERQDICKLPVVPPEIYDTHTTIVVGDSKIGWATAYRELISLLYSGKKPKWDTSQVRPGGARLKTFGGRASGPEPLEELFKFTCSVFNRAKGRKLSSIECHDLVCKVAEVIVVGGVRRSALISLSNLTDERMRVAKNGQWWETNQQRALANNSVSYTEKPDMGIFLKEWTSLYESKSGERGIFSRPASKIQAEKTGRRDSDYEFGTNPCSEIILRSKQVCNLSEIIIRPEDTLESLLEKAELATILGTLQSTLTNFRYVSETWKKNTEEERLLGVSLTGIMDHPILNNINDTSRGWLKSLKDKCIEVNKTWADNLGIPQSTSIHCVKPSGTVSQLCDTASGIHARHAPYYIRTVRAAKTDPLAKMLVSQGFPHEDDVTAPDRTLVFSFPMKSPEFSVYRNDRSAIEQMELWKFYQEVWCEHKPSITVTVKENEWFDVGAWVYKNFDIVSGISFLPHTDHSYRQAPYQDIDEDSYNRLIGELPKGINWGELSKFELEDSTEGAKELACVAGYCEI